MIFGVANRHFGKVADVWKHLVLCEVLAGRSPRRYAETHAGSGAYELVRDEERQYGVLHFAASTSSSQTLRDSSYFRAIAGYLEADPQVYPGSALQAMTLLGDDSEYLLCDLDPQSAADLRNWSVRRGLHHCHVVQEDGLAAVENWLSTGCQATVVHIDPFDPFAKSEGGRSAIELAAQVATLDAGLVYWYGADTPDEKGWALSEIGKRTNAALWCGDIMVTDPNGEGRDGHLGSGTTAGTGFGLILANVSPATVRVCQELGHALAEAYETQPLPSGESGRLEFTSINVS